MADREKMVRGAKAARSIDAYLGYIAAEKPRGRKVDPEALQRKIEVEPSLSKKVVLISRLHDALAAADQQTVEERLEEYFLEDAARFSEQHGVKYAAWREMGVSPDVLKRAGIKP